MWLEYNMRVLNIFPLSIFCNKINLTDKKKKQMIDEIRKMRENSKLEDYMQCFKEHEAIVEAIIKRDLLAVKKAIKQNIK